ncbi:MAG: S9 family peptidase [Phycisphaerales bacterium]|nr:S9 family peptidase [Phycisphaerales bacterium]
MALRCGGSVCRVSGLLVLASMMFTGVAAGQFDYPDTAREPVVDDYHGVKVTDPYRWLEGNAKTEGPVRQWVESENALTFQYLDSIAIRDRIRDRLTTLLDYERITSPYRGAPDFFKAGGRYYYGRNDGLQAQAVMYVKDTLNGPPRVLLDPNTWSEDGTVALAGAAFSDDGRYMAYGIARAGSDWNEWYVRDIETGQDLPDHLEWVKFSGAAWTPDGRGFFYSRYDAPKQGEEFLGVSEYQKLYYHRVGTAQSEDVLVYRRSSEEEKYWGFNADVSEDGRYLIIYVWRGAEPRNLIFYKDLDEPYGMPVELISEFEAGFDFVGNDGPVFYFVSDWEAPRGRIIAIDTRAPARGNWKTLVPETSDKLEGAELINNLFVASYLKDATSQVNIFRTNGQLVRSVDLPGIGTASGFSGRRSDTETFYSFSSYATPQSIMRYDMVSGESRLIDRAKVDFDPSQYEVKQVFYTSKDGTRIPMFISHRKGLQLDGSNPTLLYGYGGFNISLTPGFSVSRALWMEMGGVYAVANLRGGGEYGEAWHEAGTKAKKQNVFDDFIAAAEYLIANNYTRPDKLAIQGGSNGGLLVGACLTQRPDLFGACLPAVGVMDMLRYDKFTAGVFWRQDYGSSENAEDFRYLYAYSPYHNIKEGVKYPATMITTADTDDRVVPGHSFKFAAALQRAQAGEAPILIRIETSAGHGAGKPLSKVVEETSDMWAFLVKNLNMDVSWD